MEGRPELSVPLERGDWSENFEVRDLARTWEVMQLGGELLEKWEQHLLGGEEHKKWERHLLGEGLFERSALRLILAVAQWSVSAGETLRFGS